MLIVFFQEEDHDSTTIRLTGPLFLVLKMVMVNKHNSAAGGD